MLANVVLSDAVESFFDRDGFRIVLQKDEWTEKRYYWTGKTGEGRILTTRYTTHGAVIKILGSAEIEKFRTKYRQSKQLPQRA